MRPGQKGSTAPLAKGFNGHHSHRSLEVVTGCKSSHWDANGLVGRLEQFFGDSRIFTTDDEDDIEDVKEQAVAAGASELLTDKTWAERPIEGLPDFLEGLLRASRQPHQKFIVRQTTA